MKRIHNRRLKSRGFGIRYYAVGEYGETYGRPHYHACVFGDMFPDRRFVEYSPAGEKLFHSAELQDLWPYGRNRIGDITFDSAAYCSGYVTKKITGELADTHYMRVSPDGVVYMLQPEFAIMSRRPGIGMTWFEKFGKEAYAWDSVIMNGREIRPPRAYDVRYELLDAQDMKRLKSRRKRRALLFRSDNTYARRRVKEVVRLRKLALFRRDVG